MAILIESISNSNRQLNFGQWPQATNEKLSIRPIKDTLLIRYSCIVEDPNVDLPYLKATVDTLVEYLNQDQFLVGRVTIVSPVQAPARLPIFQHMRYVYGAGCALVALMLSFAVVKLAQNIDSRPLIPT